MTKGPSDKRRVSHRVRGERKESPACRGEEEAAAAWVKQQLRPVELGDGEILNSSLEDALRMISTVLGVRAHPSQKARRMGTLKIR